MKREEVIKYCEDQWAVSAVPNTNFSFKDAYMMGVRTCIEHVEHLRSLETTCDFEAIYKDKERLLKMQYEDELKTYKNAIKELESYNNGLLNNIDLLKAKVEMVELIFGSK